MCVGFGDYVPTFQPHQERTFGTYFVLYQLFILLWFITGTFVTSFSLIADAAVVCQFWISNLMFPCIFFCRRRLSCHDCRISYKVSLKRFGALKFLWTCGNALLFSRGLRSKRIKRIEHNLAINIKETQKKIWNGVTKDVGYIRKILNEVYFLKFKVRR